MTRPTFVTVAGLALLATASAHAQMMRGEIGVSAGMATDQRGFRSNAVTLAPSILVAPDPHVSAGLALTGTQFGSNARTLGGTASLGTHVPIVTGLALGTSASGSLTRTSFGASYGSVDVTPTLEGSLANLTIFAGGHLASGSTSLREPVSTPGSVVGAPTVGTRDVTVSHTSAGPVFGAVMNVAGARPGEGGMLSYREEHARVTGVNVVDRVASGVLNSGPLSFGVSGGFRDAPDEQKGFGGVSATWSVGPSFAIQGAAGTYPSNRISGTLGGNYASIGVLLHGLRRLDDSAPAPLRGAPAVPVGATRLAIRAPGASRVELAGDWNSWTPLSATRAGDGMWYADVRLSPGEYRYAFKVDGKEWMIPEGASSVDDGFGGRSAIVNVR